MTLNHTETSNIYIYLNVNSSEKTLRHTYSIKANFRDRRKHKKNVNKAKLFLHGGWTGAKCQWSHTESQLMRAGGVSRQRPEWKGVILHATFKVEWIINGLAMDTERSYQYLILSPLISDSLSQIATDVPIHMLNLLLLGDKQIAHTYKIESPYLLWKATEKSAVSQYSLT